MDEYFAVMGPLHRKIHHHREGVGQAEKLFGKRGHDAAVVHILRDCRHIPEKQDYESGKVDRLGLISDWPVTAYIRYPEEAFVALVNFALNGPTGKVLWIFFRSQADLGALLSAATHLGPEDQQKVLSHWDEAHSRFEQLTPVRVDSKNFQDPTQRTLEHFSLAVHHPLIQALSAQFGSARPAVVQASALINPVAIIDLQYVEELRPSLEGNDELAVAKFSAPESLAIQMRAMVDPTMRRVTLFSGHKTMVVSPIQMAQIPGVGIEAKFIITGMPQAIVVSRVGNRLILRSGIHRAYLLASLGHTEIPCLLVDEESIPTIVGIYPCFTPSVLAAPRPPLLTDALDPRNVVDVPLIKTQKMISISAEELIFPSE